MKEDGTPTAQFVWDWWCTRFDVCKRLNATVAALATQLEALIHSVKELSQRSSNQSTEGMVASNIKILVLLFWQPWKTKVLIKCRILYVPCPRVTKQRSAETLKCEEAPGNLSAEISIVSGFVSQFLDQAQKNLKAFL